MSQNLARASVRVLLTALQYAIIVFFVLGRLVNLLYSKIIDIFRLINLELWLRRRR